MLCVFVLLNWTQHIFLVISVLSRKRTSFRQIAHHDGTRFLGSGNANGSLFFPTCLCVALFSELDKKYSLHRQVSRPPSAHQRKNTGTSGKKGDTTDCPMLIGLVLCVRVCGFSCLSFLSQKKIQSAPSGEQTAFGTQRKRRQCRKKNGVNHQFSNVDSF